MFTGLQGCWEGEASWDLQESESVGPGASNLSLMAVVLGPAVIPSTSLQCPEVLSDCHLFNQVHTPDWVCQDSIWQYFMFF